jgi:hypothetical protein
MRGQSRSKEAQHMSDKRELRDAPGRLQHCSRKVIGSKLMSLAQIARALEAMVPRF